MWAPHATQVSVIGDLNHRAPEATPLERWGDSGIWTGFVPGVREEALLGLRIDRPDGLLNPGEYCGRLQQAVG